jgi:hypothetical protein
MVQHPKLYSSPQMFDNEIWKSSHKDERMDFNTAASGDMESDLKNLQTKIMDLENKLSFTHSALEEGFELKQNVHIDATAFNSLTSDVVNI